MVQLPAKSVCALRRKQPIMCLTLDFNLGPQILKVGPNRGQLGDRFKLCREPSSLRNNEIGDADQDFNLGPQDLKVGPNRGQLGDHFELCADQGGARTNEI